MSVVNDVVFTVFSGRFFIGFVVGAIVQRGWCHAKTHWLDKHHPLPGGKRRKPGGLDRIWLAAAVVFIIMGSVMYTTTQTHEETVANAKRTEELSAQVKDCQDQLIETIKKRAKITADNDHWSEVQRKALADWLGILLTPPTEIMSLDRQGEEYRNWSIDVTQYYYGIIQKAQIEQDQNAKERAQNPLPEPNCGK